MNSALDSCRWVRSQLSRFLDDALAADLAGRVSVHLERCSGCTAELARERAALVETIEHLVHAEPRSGAFDTAFEGALATIGPEVAATPRVQHIPARGTGDGPGWFGTASRAAAAVLFLACALWLVPARDVSTEENSSVARAPQPEAPAVVIAPVAPVAPVVLPDGGIDPTADEPESLLVRRGDVDGNGRFEAADVSELFRYLQDDATPLACLAAGDLDDDGEITMHDSVIAARTLGESDDTQLAASPVFSHGSDHPLPCAVYCP